MSIRNYDIAKLVSYCDYHNEDIERPNYINSWNNTPLYAYNPDKVCRQFEEKKLIHHPIVRSNINNLFNYKTNKPLSDNRGIVRYESFSINTHYTELFIVAIVLIIIYKYIK